MAIENVDIKTASPKEYLKDGFFDADGNMREGINGISSLGVAYQLRDESVQPDALKNVVDQLTALGEEYFKRGGDSAKDPLDASTLSAIDRIWRGRDIGSSPALGAVYEAAKPLLKDWHNFSALLVHLERIMGQLALITKTRFEPDLPHQRHPS